jgi:benzil reductase ((S)-benzoin forming)
MAIAYLVTGTTRGIGRALARQIIANGDLLFSLSSAPHHRTASSYNVSCDLSDPNSVETAFEQLVGPLHRLKGQPLVLINNAGVLDPIGPIESASIGMMTRHMAVNCLAPAILTSLFIRDTADFQQRRIINVSSGAAGHPYAGLSMYCCTKAGLEMMTLCIAAEQSLNRNPVAICAVSPGRVETRMQQRIRSTSPRQFPAQPDFIDAKRRGLLDSPERVADVLLTLDRNGQLRNGLIFDLRDVVDQGGRMSIRPIRS